MSTPEFPVQLCQLVSRGDMGIHEWKKACWKAEFEEALKAIQDVNVRNALYALKQYNEC